jgi:uncharacterized protein (DUF2147 family)
MMSRVKTTLPATLASGLTLGLALVLVSPPQPALANTGLVGTWIDHTGRGAVEFTRCGPALCGRIVWMKDPADAAGKPLTDGNNPEPGKRRNPICGLQVIGDAKPQADGSFDQGWVYDPEDGKSYSVEVRQVSPNIATVRGYLGLKMLGEQFTWKRAPATLGRCSA